MKSTKILACALAASLMFTLLPGCSSRKKNETPPAEPIPKAEAPAEKLPAEPAAPEDKIPGTSSSPSSSDKAAPPADKASGDATTFDNPLSQEIPSATTAGGNLADLASLPSAKNGWGPGGPVDEDNRSSGALSAQTQYGKYNADFLGEKLPKIYLTFDEGYENGYTGEILDVLKEKGVSAVFFVTMPYAKGNPELVRRMIDEGHTVGNHSVTHPSFPDTPLTECRDEVTGLHDYILETFNYTMTLFRFPMGEFSEQDLALVQGLGYRSVFWSFAYKDWLVDAQPEPATALATILEKSHPGGIYLLHAVSKTNTDILPQVIDGLREKGLEVAPYPVVG